MTETAAKPKRTRAKAPPIWCDHCNAEIMPASVRSCVRQTCATKERLHTMKSHSFAAMPALDFNCRLVYLTAAGHRRHSHHKTRAIAADIAIEIAERQLRADKRRSVASVVYGEAIQQ